MTVTELIAALDDNVSPSGLDKPLVVEKRMDDDGLNREVVDVGDDGERRYVTVVYRQHW